MQHAAPSDLVFLKHSIKHHYRGLEPPAPTVHIDQRIPNGHLGIQPEPENQAMHRPTNPVVADPASRREGADSSKAVRAVTTGDNP
jgi:hypothetical protein